MSIHFAGLIISIMAWVGVAGLALSSLHEDPADVLAWAQLAAALVGAGVCIAWYRRAAHGD
jgi:hypothetical protein